MADIDWESTFGDAAAGASAGAALGPWGAIGGGLIGLGAGIFGGKKKTPHFTDPYAWQRDYASRQLLQSDIGAKGAAAQAGAEMNFARDQASEAASNPMLAGNASAQSGIRNKLLRGAEHGAQSAYLRGAEIDTANIAKGAQIAGESSALAQSQFQMNQGYADRPTFGEQFLQQGVSTLAGYGLSKVMSPGAPQNDPGQIADKTVADANMPPTLPNISAPNVQAPSPEPPSFNPMPSMGGSSFNGFPASDFDPDYDYGSQSRIPDNTDGTDWDQIRSNSFGRMRGASYSSFNPFARN